MILNKDNKILRNLSGAILEKSDYLIDMRSTYGVTKNASNEVSKVNIFNNPSQIFRSDIGNEPIENGNGFEFTTNTTSIAVGDHKLNYDNLIITAWVKVNTLGGDQRIINKWRFSYNRFQEFILRFNGNILSLFYSPNGAGIGDHNYTIPDPVNWNNKWRNVGFWFNKSHLGWWYLCFLIDGKVYNKGGGITFTNPQNINLPITLGARSQDNDSNSFIGSIDDFKIDEESQYSLVDYEDGDIVFTPKSRSSE